MNEKVKGKNASDERQARLAAALRDNLRKRKTQTRTRQPAENADDAMIPPPKSGNAPTKE